jgi:uncharacterized protein (TIGR02594 family)
VALPSRYAYLLDPGVPSVIREAVKLYGTLEKAGSGNNPVILGWADELEKEIGPYFRQYTADSIPWCGLFVGIVCYRAGWLDQMPKTPLWAKSWGEFGQKSERPSLGDVMVFTRNGGGHVALYVGEDSSNWHILGGNQSDQVSIARRPKSGGLFACRRPKWRVSEPESVKPIRLTSSGPVVVGKEA